MEHKFETSVSPKLTNIYRGRYKEGPVQREYFFLAENLEHAVIQSKKYLDYLAKTAEHNRSFIPIGKIEPFAMDVDKFIATETEKREKLYGAPVL